MIKHLPPRILTKKELREYKKSQEFRFPRMQRITARLIGDDLVSVQPMAAPKATSFYMFTIFNENGT